MFKIRLFEREEWSRKKHYTHLAIYLAVILSTIGLDQLSKWLVVQNMELKESIPLWEGVFHFTHVTNTGAAFSMLNEPNQRWIFILISSVAIVGLLFYLWADRTVPLLGGISLAMVLGGGIGNMIDRLALGYVVDFFDFRLINFAIFNVADCFVCIGAGLMILTIILTWVNEIKKKKNSKEEPHEL